MAASDRFTWVSASTGGNIQKAFVLVQKNQGLCSAVGHQRYYDNLALEMRRRPVEFPVTDILLCGPFDDLVGFVLIRSGESLRSDASSELPVTVRNPAAWYIELICAKAGHGRRVMNEVMAAASERGIKQLCLSAIPDVIMFYYRIGFKLTLDVTGAEDAALRGLAESIKAAGRRYNGLADAFQDRTFVAMMILAIKNKLAMAQNRGDAKCDEKDLAECEANGSCDRIRECVADGVYMTMNLQTLGMSLSARRPAPFDSSALMSLKKRARTVTPPPSAIAQAFKNAPEPPQEDFDEYAASLFT